MHDSEEKKPEEGVAPAVTTEETRDSFTLPATYNTVVIGAGPIGLMAAVCALKHSEASEKVAIVADRMEELGVRQQVLWIQEDVFAFIKDIAGAAVVQKYIDDLSITEDPHEGYYITTGDLERLFYDVLSSHYTAGVDYDVFQSQKLAPSQKPDELIQVDLDNRCVSITGLACNNSCFESGPKSIPLKFKYLIAADGAKRSLVKTLGSDVVFFDKTQEPLIHTKHVVATFRIPEGTTPRRCSELKVHLNEARAGAGTGAGAGSSSDPTPQSRVYSPLPLSELQEKYHWEGHARPYSQIYSTRDVIYIGAEMPRSLPRELAGEYAKQLMKDSLPEDYLLRVDELPCDLTTNFGKKQKQLSVSIFDIELGDINRTVLACGDTSDESKTGVLFFMGDARKNPLYTTGTGAQTGIREVMQFESFLDKQSTHTRSLGDNLTEYHAETRRILDDIIALQNKWVSGRNTRHLEAEQNFLLDNIYHEKIKAFGQLALIGVAINTDLKKHEMSPDFMSKICDEITSLTTNYSKAINASESIYSYNDMKMSLLLADINVLYSHIFSEYPSVDSITYPPLTDASTKSQIEDFYVNMKRTLEEFQTSATAAPKPPEEATKDAEEENSHKLGM